MDVSVIIVSYNTRDVTVAAVRSVFKTTSDCAFEVIVVDNASTDGSAGAIREACPRAHVIANADNRGFAAANNQGMRAATGRYLLLLNPDTEARQGTIRDTLEYADREPTVGVIGCRVIGPDGRQQGTLMRQKRLSDVVVNAIVPGPIMRRSRILGRSRYIGIDLDLAHDVDIVAGCFMFVRREAYEQVGGMDEDFFIYGEESEWCCRIRRAEWIIRYYPETSILHYGGVSADRRSSEMSLNMARGNLLLLLKTTGPVTAYAANICMLLRDAPRAALWGVWRHLRRTPEESGFESSLRRAAARCGLHLKGLLGVHRIMYR